MPRFLFVHDAAPEGKQRVLPVPIEADTLAEAWQIGDSYLHTERRDGQDLGFPDEWTIYIVTLGPIQLMVLPCARCQQTGRIDGTPCPVCRGTGYTDRNAGA
jgi:hypothetical protein